MPEVDLSNLLERKVEEAAYPKAVPVGTYNAQVTSYEGRLSAVKQTPHIRFFFMLLAAGDDVDPEELEAVGGIEGKSLNKDFFLPREGKEDKTLWRLRDFIADCCGIDVEGKDFAEVIPETLECEVRLLVEHEPSEQDPKRVYARVAQVMPV